MAAIDAPSDLASLRRTARILVLLHAAGEAGLCPVNILALHAFAYLANVLAPVWDMPPQDGRILKRKGGPFYPDLQRDLDRLVGRGMVRITGVAHDRDLDGRWRLEGSYSLDDGMAGPAVRFLLSLPAEREFSRFVKELAYAMSALREEELERALVEDATYADPGVSNGNVVDFDEWTHRNPSANAARYFDRLRPAGALPVTPGEKLHLYVRHLHRRVHAG